MGLICSVLRKERLFDAGKWAQIAGLSGGAGATQIVMITQVKSFRQVS